MITIVLFPPLVFSHFVDMSIQRIGVTIFKNFSDYRNYATNSPLLSSNQRNNYKQK